MSIAGAQRLASTFQEMRAGRMAPQRCQERAKETKEKRWKFMSSALRFDRKTPRRVVARGERRLFGPIRHQTSVIHSHAALEIAAKRRLLRIRTQGAQDPSDGSQNAMCPHPCGSHSLFHPYRSLAGPVGPMPWLAWSCLRPRLAPNRVADSKRLP